MKHLSKYFPFLMIFFCCEAGYAQNPRWFPKVSPEGKKIVDTRRDNLSYWKHMISLGYVEGNPYLVVPDAIPTGSVIRANGVFVQDSPDVPVTEESETTQSETSIFVNPENENVVLNSNNSTDWTGATIMQLYGSDYLYSSDAAASWGGSVTGAGQSNSGDPTTAIGRNGWWYVGKISNNWGQNVAYSTDQGQTWTDVVSGPAPGGSDILDKNHLWIDNSLTSPYEGYLYNAWTSFISGASNDGEIEIVRSSDHGLTWTSPLVISAEVHAGSHNQGVNIQTGPNGEVYAFWAIYDSWPSDETAIGMAKSIDGGGIFTPAVRVISNIKGIRNSETNKNMRVNSFPVAAVDISNGPYRGTIYVTWTNIGVPGINSGTDIDAYLIRSMDGGATWSSPIRINQDPAGLGKNHFFPWITCDPVTGNLAVLFYDDRNTSSEQAEAWVAFSYDAGDTWTELKVSDVAFTPGPITGLATGYFGDYLGVQANNMKVYPVWTDNRSGRAMAYVSPIDIGPPPNQPFVTYHSNELSLITGKGRQNMNYGDSLYLNLGMKNIGDQPGTSLSVSINTDSPYILITDSIENYGTMAPGEIKTIPQGYSLKVSDTIPDNLQVKINVRTSDEDTTWISHFMLESHAPQLVIIGFVIDDLLTGNGNHRLDPGETADIIVTTSNTGDFDCLHAYGHLSSLQETVSVINDSVYYDTIPAGGSKTATFSVMVGEEVPPSSGISLLAESSSGLYHTSYHYIGTVGALVEDWETHTFTKFPWQFGGNKNWILTDDTVYEGVWSAESGWIYENQTSELKITYSSAIDDSISFYRQVSSEPEWDFLYFFIDGVRVGQWSGEIPWGRVAFPVVAGTHTFKWSYVKDVYLNVGDDRARIDYITFPPPVFPEMNAGPDDTICAGSTYQLAGQESLADSLIWTTSGDGNFDNDTLLNAVYNPGTNDIIAGSVKLTLRGYALYTETSNSMILTIGNIPQVSISVDPNDTVCHWQSIMLSLDTLEPGTYWWTPGSFTTPSITADTSLTGGIGTTWFNVTKTNLFGCANHDSIAISFKDCTAIEEPEAAFRFAVTPNPSDGHFTLDISTPVPEIVALRLYSNNHALIFSEEGIRVQQGFTRKLDFSKLAAGIYLLEVERSEGTTTGKILIRK